MKKTFFTLFFVLLSCVNSISAPQPLQFTITTDNNIYATSDRIVVHLDIFNDSGGDLLVTDLQQVQIWLLSARIITFDIVDEHGERIKMKGQAVDYWPSNRAITLKYYERMMSDVIINDHNAKNYYPMSKQARYKITAVYHGLAGREIVSNSLIIDLE